MRLPVGSEALERLRIADGIPLYGVDIRERDLPQETEQVRALNFNKGCYVGQEIVERIRSRGNVHRKFTGFLIEGAGNVAAGDKIISGEKEVGEITSVGVLPTPSGERTAALGYIRREVGAPGREVTVGDDESDGDSVAVRPNSSSGTASRSRCCNGSEKTLREDSAVSRRTRKNDISI